MSRYILTLLINKFNNNLYTKFQVYMTTVLFQCRLLRLEASGVLTLSTEFLSKFSFAAGDFQEP